MLDHSICEFAVMTKVGNIAFDTPLVAPPDVKPLAELLEVLELAEPNDA